MLITTLRLRSDFVKSTVVSPSSTERRALVSVDGAGIQHGELLLSLNSSFKTGIDDHRVFKLSLLMSE